MIANCLIKYCSWYCNTVFNIVDVITPSSATIRFVLICKSIDFCCCMLLVYYLSVIVCFPIMQDSIC